MQLLTAKLPPKELAVLKKQLLRPGFVEEWNNLDAMATGFAKALSSKENQQPSASFKLFTSYDPEAVLWLGFTSKDGAVKERFNQFLKVWPEIRQRIPYALMQEMRIKPELPNYNEIVQSIFMELIDGKLTTPEDMKAFLEPHSPPAPPPQVTIKRTRAKRGSEAKVKDSFDDEDEDSEDGLESDDDLDDMGGDEDEIGLGMGIPKVDLEPDSADDSEPGDADDDDEDDEPEPAPVKRGAKGASQHKESAAVAAPAKGAEANKGKAISKPAPEANHGSKSAGKHAPPNKQAAVAAKPNHPPQKGASAHAPLKPAIPAKSAPIPAVKKAGDAHPHTASKTIAKGAPVKPGAHKPAGKPIAKHAHGKQVESKNANIAKGHKPVKPALKKPAPKKH
jgi:tRNA nucleotidyltransferase (CCA-adding enzyme)